MKSLFILASVLVVLFFLTGPNKIEAQKRIAANTIEGTVVGHDGTEYWSGLRIKSGGKEYTFVSHYNAKQGINPKIVGKNCCDIGTRVRVTFKGSTSRYLLDVTRIVILGAATGSQFMPPDGSVILVPVPAKTATKPLTPAARPSALRPQRHSCLGAA